ncbi:S1 family peptidase [Saccharothrix syringae]|uniref:S1 family peptidase n=1 Tax=Saccharothrix syringae TaxID=103733 RepID=A0A5Q0GQQ4_SACSY|nr:S1 family peptidase [Saccharothrix syringae]QFZ16426.1 S1 family peptidase [Saccharothrix syringae]
MNRTSAVRLATATLLAVGSATALSVPAIATAAAPYAASPADTESYPAELLQAAQRDLGLTAEQVTARLASDTRAGEVESAAKAAVGHAYAGSWINSATGRLVVAVTDAAKADAARAAGADVRRVAFSHQQLTGAKASLDGMAAPKAITSWRVDEQTNSVVVEVNRAQRDASAEAFIAQAKSVSPSVRVVEVAESPTTLYDTRGGDAYYIGSSRCSIGFAVTGGFVTAGHCGRSGNATTGYNRVSQGTFAGSSFPGNDYAWVRTNSNWTSRPWVNRYNGSNVTVTGSTSAAVGAAICRSGSTTGWHCGTVQAKNSTVNYPQGTVSGLTRTNACAEPGDSGGSWVAGSGYSQAQGVTSGGSGNCSSGGTTYFQPVGEILSAYGLSLTRG